MDMVDILFNDAKLFEQIDNTPTIESTYVKSYENQSSCFRAEDI